MLLAARVFFGLFGALCLALALVCSRKLLKMRAWKMSQGRVVMNDRDSGADGGVCYHPVVEHEWNGSTTRFKSSYGFSKEIQPGTAVDVLVDPTTGTGELYRPAILVGFSLAGILFSAIFTLLAFGINEAG